MAPTRSLRSDSRHPLGWEAALAGFTLLYAVVWGAWSVCHGYGFDDDAYSLVRVVQQAIAEHVYLPSRFQGAVAAELPEGLAAHLMGSLGSNLVVAACSVAGLWAFTRTLALYGIGARALVVARHDLQRRGADRPAPPPWTTWSPSASSAWASTPWRRARTWRAWRSWASAPARASSTSPLAEASILFVLLERRRAGRRGEPDARRRLHARRLPGLGPLLPLGLVQPRAQAETGWRRRAPRTRGVAGLLVRWAYKAVMFAGLPALLLAAAGWLWRDRGRRTEATLRTRRSRGRLRVLRAGDRGPASGAVRLDPDRRQLPHPRPALRRRRAGGPRLARRPGGADNGAAGLDPGGGSIR